MKRVLPYIIILCLSTPFARAQTGEPTLLITWTANRSSAPADFVGKIFPGARSSISASVALIENGRAINLSGETIQWYANNSFLDGGQGMTRISFGATQVAPNTISLRAQLPFYNDSFVVKTVEIPVVRPEAVIDAPFPRGIFSQNPVTIKALPFFFTVPNFSFLRFSWNVNGSEPTNQETPSELLINIPTGTASGSSFSARLTIENPVTFGQVAEKNTNLIFKK
jgi:hypothetical protein